MRYLTDLVLRDLERKMVFVGGPRQCGKTTFAKQILEAKQGSYFNYDDDRARQRIRKHVWPEGDELIVLDELHKMPRWKTWVKGVFDTRPVHQNFLVTGSARLDVYRRGGDSLLGRYHYWRLHPFSLCERPKGISAETALKRLLSVGGFPEPFLDGNEREARRWRRERVERVVRDDVRDLEGIRNLGSLELFVDALRTRVSLPLVLHNIAEDLQVADRTLKAWLEVLERMYLVFAVRPYTKRVMRAIQKTPKVYFFDTGDVQGDEGARFENLVATHLLKRIQFLQDRDGFRYELAYVRDKSQREVDFVILKDGKVVELIEAKLSDASPSPSLVHFAELLEPKRAIQVCAKPVSKRRYGRLEVVGATELFTSAWREAE
jgi:uncharacterized protein